MGAIVSSMANFGVLATAGGLEADADKAAREANLGQIARSKALNAALEVDSLRRGADQAGLSRMQATRVQGAQKVAYAAGNIDSSSGTAAQLADSTGIYAELDAQTTMNNARREALGYRKANEDLDFKVGEQERLLKARETKRTADLVSAGVSVIGSAASFGMGG